MELRLEQCWVLHSSCAVFMPAADRGDVNDPRFAGTVPVQLSLPASGWPDRPVYCGGVARIYPPAVGGWRCPFVAALPIPALGGNADAFDDVDVARFSRAKAARSIPSNRELDWELRLEQPYNQKIISTKLDENNDLRRLPSPFSRRSRWPGYMTLPHSAAGGWSRWCPARAHRSPLQWFPHAPQLWPG